MYCFHRTGLWLPVAALAMLCRPANATVKITSLTPTLASPQQIGANISWTAKGTDTNTGPLTFKFSVSPPGGTMTTVKNFNVGTLSGSAWKSMPFVWALTGIDGKYQVQVVAEDFTSGETATKTVAFIVTSPVS